MNFPDRNYFNLDKINKYFREIQLKVAKYDI